MKTTVRSRAEVESEIQNTLGLVPSFFDQIPDEYLDHEWELFSTFELEETLIPSKYKHLMALALHSETRCRYCTLFHTEAAKLFGATEEEIQEAVHFAKHSVGWSVYLNGMQVDNDAFADELSQMTDFLSKQPPATAV